VDGVVCRLFAVVVGGRQADVVLSRASWVMRVSSNNQRSTSTVCGSVLNDRLSLRVLRRTRSRASRLDRNRTLSSDTSRTAVHVTLTAARSPLRMIFGRITSCSGSSALFAGPPSACRPSGGYLQSLIVTRKGSVPRPTRATEDRRPKTEDRRRPTVESTSLPGGA
jgi:hypothetical protein